MRARKPNTWLTVASRWEIKAWNKGERRKDPFIVVANWKGVGKNGRSQ